MNNRHMDRVIATMAVFGIVVALVAVCGLAYVLFDSAVHTTYSPRPL